MPLSVTLQVFKSGQPAGQFQFNSITHRVLKLGKLASAQIKIEDPTASRVHAVIDISHTQATLIDMGSEAGTMVNGARVNQAKLKTNDQITIGNTTLVVALDAGMALPAAPPGQPLGPPAPVATAYAAPAAPAYGQPVQPAYAPPPSYRPAGPVPGYAPAGPPPGYAPAIPPPRPGRHTPRGAPVAGAPAMPSPMQPPATQPLASPSLAAKLQVMSRDQLAAVESFVDLLTTRGPAAAAQVFAQAQQLPGLAAQLDLAHAEEPWQPVRGKDTERLIALIKSGKQRRYLLAMAAAVVLVVGVVLLLPEKQQTTVPPPDLASPAAPAGMPRDDANFAYVRLHAARSLRDIAEAIWDDSERAALLLQHNSDAGDAAKPMAPGTIVKVPRIMEYVVAPGDTLGYIAE
ncbi:MAG: FHA domain-containing protein, partial [Deltaproteobacteria bacterium]|nr:FHA domain-containing protein [Deltaproteobacteria bacterium]